jgi:BirA family biotin operon repressor/biotin-[acetyl-CoA-carboxylase] ligase
MPATDPTSPERLRVGLLTPPQSGRSRLWSDVSVVARTGSTNADMAERLRADSGNGLVLVADHQEAGRGRFERRWVAPAGTSVAVSVGVRPRRPMPEWMWLSLFTGLAIATGIERATGIRADLKWPNDVLVGGRKLCGILSERVDTPTGPGCVVGFGINVSLDEAELPVPTATSLLLCGVVPDKAELLATVLTDWEAMYRAWDDGRLPELRETYEARCATIGRDVAVLLDAPGGTQVTVRGRAVGIDDSGAVIVDDGTRRRAFVAGDVTHLR